MFYVYRHIRLDTNTPFYVGKGKGNRYRETGKRNTYWKKIVTKHGLKAEIVASGLSESEAFALEIALIRTYRAFQMAEANFADGGQGASGVRMSPENLLKLSARSKGKKHSERTRKQMSERHKADYAAGLRQTPVGMTGKTHSESLKEQVSDFMKGKQWAKGFKHGEAFRALRSRVCGEQCSKTVIDLSTGFVWNSAKEAAQIYGFKHSTLKGWLNGTSKNPTSLRYVDGSYYRGKEFN